MKTKKGSFCLLLFTCMMLLAFVAVVPQRANAEDLQTQFEVTDYDEFKEAISYIDGVVSALGEGETSPDFVITLKADITLNESRFFHSGSNDVPTETFITLPPATRLTIQSPAGSRYAIKAYPLVIECTEEYKYPSVRMFENAPQKLTLHNIDLKGNVDLISLDNSCELIMKNCYCEIENRADYVNSAPKDKLGDYQINSGAYINSTGSAKVELDQVTFQGKGSCRGHMGLIYVQGKSLTMNECVFKDFNCSSRASLVSYNSYRVEGEQELTLTDCVFENIKFPYGKVGWVGGNAAFGGQGNDKSIVTVTGGSFRKCQAISHPAMVIYGAKEAKVTGVEFSENKAQVLGAYKYKNGDAAGAVRIHNCLDFLMEGCIFTKNYSDLSGGAMQFWNSVGTIRGTEFKENEAETHGGAICLVHTMQEGWGTKLYLEDVSVLDNVVHCSHETLATNDGEHPGGGGIFQHMDTEVHLGKGTVIQGNRVENSGHGGGVYVSFGAELYLKGSSILNNVANGNGGGVYLDGADSFSGKLSTLDQGSMNSGGRLLMHNGIIAGNTAVKGGGVFLGGKNLIDDRITANGGIIDMLGGVITANHALSMGGGLYLENSDYLDYNSSILNMGDGAIYFNEAGTAEAPPYNIDPEGAGAEVYSEGANTYLNLRTAEQMTAYIQDPDNSFVPEKDRNVWFMNWYEDFNATRGPQTRYMLTKVLDRVYYTPTASENFFLPEGRDMENRALILDRSTALKVTKTEKGDAPANAEYGFELKFTNLPPREEALPVVITDAGGKMTEKEVTPEGGVFNFTLKNGESFKVSGLPAGAKFILTEKDHGSAKKLAASFTNVEESNLNGWTVSGKTRSTWQGSSEATKLSVVELINDYTPEKQEPKDKTLDEYGNGTDEYEPKKQDSKDKTLDKYQNDPDEYGKVKGVETGDNTHMIGWIAVLIVSALTAIAVFIRRRCQNN